ncbi:filamentous hemagglutinin N-terminal domain-containing protein, partial [Janthinobacterium sp. PC23-8]|uniref:two-partner secretion domain-containing protein n=1 Tax=Janthinobacterium sp. PC23-8 TaxID=2012679 RepID=UPI000B95CBC3
MNGHATINRFYRLIWSEKQGAWVAVAENVRGRGKSSGRGAFMAALFAGLGLAPFAWAGPPGANQLPTGGQVVGGAATITQSGSQMTINQASQRGAIDWQTFNLGSQAQVNFQQPNSGSVTLNRVQDSQASQIFGRITANGQVFLSNPNGVYFSPTSSVNVGGLVATTHAIGTAEFMAGSNTFERNGATGSVINDGSLNASLGGYIALLAPQVRNNGIVIAQAGTVAMAAGEQISLQFADSRTLAGVLVSPSTIAALVENGSAVQAPGGMIIMSAQAANDLQGGVVRNTGSVAATGLASRGGKIVLDSTGLVDNSGSLDASGAPGGKGKVTISGERMASSGAVRADGGGTISSTLTHGLVETASAVISAQGGGNITVDGGAGKVYTSGNYNADGEQGGKVVITANEVALMGAKVSATGVSQGGAILIGGDYQGKNADVHNAAKTSVGAGVTLNADATGNGNGGKVVVWSDEKTVFAGELTARGGAAGGDGGILEVSGKETLYFGGKADAHAAKGKSGALLLDPKDIYIDSDLSGQLELVDPHPTAGGSFGKLNAPLTTTSGSTATRTGYIVVTNPNDNLGATNSGAAYLFRQSDQALISTLYGTHAGDKVGSNGVTSLTNGNYVVSSNLWNGGMGAVTWGNGTTGWGASALAVSSSNSLVGSHATHKSTMNQDTSDNIGAYAITVLNNGNYLVGTPSWSDNRGALTFGNGSTGVAGIVSSANSLVGSTAMTVVPADGYKRYKSGDLVGSGVTVLANNNYVMANENWNKGVGAVTFASGTTGIKGVVGTSNSLIGDSSRFDSTGAGTGTDKVGSRVMVLTGSQFVVYGSDWKNSSGALTSFDGVTAITGLVSASNSLVGTAGDSLSSGGLTLLPSNNAFVISSPSWNGGRGAATWVPFSTDVKTVSVATNGVVGANAGDSVGSKAIALLANNDYVVISPNWSSGKGAATLVDGTTGKAKADQSGNVSASTSLVGAQANDVVGSNGILELKGNGNYVVLSPYWANGSNTKAGAVTWSSGSTPTVGVVGTSNSLVGTSANDRIGSYQYNYYQANNSNAFLSESSSITLLSNGNYVVASPMFNGTRGAVTWSSGATGATVDAGHTITATNSLLGSNTADFIGGFMGPNDVITNAGNHTVTHYDSISTGVTALSNGNYVTISNYWRNGAALRAGAVTWSDGAGTPTIGPVSASNSLVGTVQDDMAGLAKNNTYGLTLLQSGYDSAGNISYSGNYVVTSNKWDNGSIVDAGAVTWGSGTAALSGAISDSNSVPGLKTDDVKEWGLTALPVNGNYLIQNQYWNNGAAIGAGALTWVDGSSGRLLDHAAQGNHNIVSGANSLVGSHSGDNVGNTVDYLYNLDATTGQQRFTGNYVALSYNWTNDTRQYAGAVTWGNGATGVKGVITRANSLIGEKENDALGAYYVALTNGNFVVANPTLDVGGVVNAGAVSWVDGSTGRLNDYAAQGNQNIMSGANALVGSHTNDYVGGILSPVVNYTSNPADYGNTGYFIMSPDWNCSAGAVNYISDASVPLIGVVGAGNAAVGNPNSRFWGGLTYNPNISLTSGGAATVTFTGDNGHVVLLSTTMPTPGAMTLPGATQFGDAQGATQAMTPDYIAGVLKTGTSVTLQANNDIFVKNGIDATGGTAGGALTMQAGRSITVLGDIITGNRDLNLIANDSVANGVKDAYRDAGIATLSMGSNKQGVAARIDAGSGDVSLLIAAGADKTNNMAGSISVNSITARTIKLINQGNGAGTVGDLPNLAANCCGFDLGYRGIGADVTLNAGAVLSASGSGDAVTLAAKGNFNNNSGNGAGSIAMSDPAARWLVYANAPGGSTYGGLDSQNTAIWNATYTGTPVTQTGNRYVFAYQPTITVGTQDVSKTYGEDLTTGTTLVDRVVSLSGGQTAQAGAYLADTVATALSGTITATSSGAAANAGVAGGPYAITVNLSGATGNNGYAVALGSNTARTITVQAKTLTAALTGVTKTYDGSTTANLGAANYSLTGLVGADAFNVTKSTAVYNLSGTGASSASTTLAGGDFSAANGSLSSNYILPTSASGAASITPKALTAALTGVTKTYDGTTSAALSGANYQLSGFVGAESATVSQAAGQYNSANVVGASSVSASLAVPDFTAGASTSLANYVLPTTATGAATITAKALTASLTGAIVKAYDGGLTAVLNPGNYSLNGFIAGESGGITQTAALYNSANVAGATTVTANLSSSDLVAGASTLASNYSLPASASGAASITAKALGATISGVGKVYDGGTAAALTGANYQLTGLVGGESASVSQTAGLYNSADVLGANSVSASLSGANFTA